MKNHETIIKKLIKALNDALVDVKKRCADLDLEHEHYSTWINATKTIGEAEEILKVS